MILVSSHHGARVCQEFARVYAELPGSWSGITPKDLRHLREGPGDRSTAAGWMQDKLYDAAWIEVVQNSRYTAPDGQTYSPSSDAEGAIVLALFGKD